MPVEAVEAGAARVEREDDVVADCDVRRSRADGLHDARPLVPEDDRRSHERSGLSREQVRVAHARGDHANEDLILHGLGEAELLERELLVGVP